MIIHFRDGDIIECQYISFYKGNLIVDEMHIVIMADVADITDNEEDE